METAMITIMPRTRLALLPLAAAFALGACGGASEEAAYETDMEDQSGGELVVTQEDPDAVPVDLAETEMTPVPVEQPAPTPAISAAPTSPQTETTPPP